jgi:transcriptional regulator with XRE-family HTH domain
MLTRTLRAAVKTSTLRQYQLAHLVGVHPATLSAWMNGIYDVSPDDARLRKLGRLVGLPADAHLVEPLPNAGTASADLTPAVAGGQP